MSNSDGFFICPNPPLNPPGAVASGRARNEAFGGMKFRTLNRSDACPFQSPKPDSTCASFLSWSLPNYSESPYHAIAGHISVPTAARGGIRHRARGNAPLPPGGVFA